MPRSNKPAPLKAEVWTRHALGQTNSQIARDLGISRNTVAKIVAERQPVQATPCNDIQRALARAGITPDTVAQKLREGMEANETKLATWEGKFTDRVEVPDHSSRIGCVVDEVSDNVNNRKDAQFLCVNVVDTWWR